MEPATHTEPKPKKPPLTPQQRRKRLRALVVRLVVYGALWAALCGGIAWLSVMPRRHALQRNPAEQRLTYRSQAFTSADGTRLAGWSIPASSEIAKQYHAQVPVIILCHGVDSTRESLLPQAKLLHDAGFAVFMFDFRARGESEGSRCTLGFHETEDLLAAIEEVKRERPGGTVIGVLGQSQGAAVSIMAAARCPEVRAVCAESPYARLDHAVANHFRDVLGPFGPLLGVPTQFFGEQLIHVRCSEVSPEEAITKLQQTPVLLIEDEADTLCPPSETASLLKASHGLAQIWRVPASGHIQAAYRQPDTYKSRVVRFFTDSLGSDKLAKAVPRSAGLN
jgi:uncharacterized protein